MIKTLRLRVPVRLDARHAAPGPDRPADGLRVEVAAARVAAQPVRDRRSRSVVRAMPAHARRESEHDLDEPRPRARARPRPRAWPSASSGSSSPRPRSCTPRSAPDVAPKFRGRLQLLYDEWGTLKCETCFQCAQACPIECIDMGGIDTKGRYHVHWGPPETYGERREESAMRRSGRTGPRPRLRALRADRPGGRWTRSWCARLRPARRCSRSSRRPRPSTATCRSPRSSTSASQTGAWYAMLYGTATYYRHLRWSRPIARSGSAAARAA